MSCFKKFWSPGGECIVQGQGLTAVTILNIMNVRDVVTVKVDELLQEVLVTWRGMYCTGSGTDCCYHTEHHECQRCCHGQS